MNCPACGLENLAPSVRFCPNCGESVEIASRVDVRVDVKHNRGRVIGVQTEAIQGDIYGGDVYQVQVYALSGAGREADWHRFLDQHTPPYKFLSPYTARDRALFKGRDVEVEQVVRRIGQQRSWVLYGAEGVGKTSLLAAGVIPELMQYGALVVHLQDYHRPLQALRAALSASADELPLELPDDADIPSLVRLVSEATQGSLVLVLDQFERFFESSVGEEDRAALVRDLARALQQVEPELLRLVVVVQEDALGRLGAWSEALPDLLRTPLQLLPLSRRQAEAAVEEPLVELGHPVSYVGDLVPAYLLPDLDALTPDLPDSIHPEHLQIVCHWLYQAACRRSAPLIDVQLYANEAMGADGIMARYLAETLQTQLADQRALAEQVLARMASPGVGRWVRAEQLVLNGDPPDRVAAVLDGLVRSDLLDRRAVDDHSEYTFASEGLFQEVRRMAGPEVGERYRAGDELERIWSAWLARGVLASRGQLRYLAQAGAHLEPAPVKLLLLLRSAAARDEPAGPWLERLRGERGRDLVCQLQDPTAAVDWPSSRVTLYKAGLLLGEGGEGTGGLGDGERGRGGERGPVARAAVGHAEPATRQTAALALAALGRREALGQLEEALRSHLQGAARRGRRAELRGALADAAPAFEEANAGLPGADRRRIWWWRARRRILRGRHRLAGLALGGAIGAGLALGLLRALLGALAHRLVGVQFAIYFYWAAILGGALALGMALAEPLLLNPAPKEGVRLPPRQRPALWGAIGGTLCFGLAHLVVAWLNGLSLVRAPLVAPLGFAAGLGLSLALYGILDSSGRRGGGVWPLRLLTAVLSFVLVQWVFVAAGDKGPGIAVSWSGGFYRAEFEPLSWWGAGPDRVLHWYDGLALLDAALVGLVLVIGLVLGLRAAGHLLERWRELVRRAET